MSSVEPSGSGVTEESSTGVTTAVIDRVFISYRHSRPEDDALAAELRDGLLAAGCEVFIDTEITAGIDWPTEIEQRIRWCTVLCVLLSEEALDSKAVQAEVRLAYRRQREEGSPRIVPVRLRYFGPLSYELEIYLGHLQYVAWSAQNDGSSLADRVLAALRAEALGDRRKPVPNVDPQILTPSGGTIRPAGPFYVTRGEDTSVDAAAIEPRPTVLVERPRQAGKFVRCVVGFGVGVSVGSAPLLGTLRVPLFSPLLELYPDSMRASLIFLSAFLMGLVALATQFASGERLSPVRLRRWFLLALGLVLAGFVSLSLMYDERVKSVYVNALDVYRTVVIAPVRQPWPDCPCKPRMTDVDCIREYFHPSRITLCWGEVPVRRSKQLLRAGYLTMTGGFGALIGLLLLLLKDGIRERTLRSNGGARHKPRPRRRRRRTKAEKAHRQSAEGGGS